MKKLYGSEVILETEWVDCRDERQYRTAVMAVRKIQITANGKRYKTDKWQWTEDGKVCTHTSRID